MKKFKLQRYSHLIDRNGSVWLLTSAFIVPFAECPPRCFLFLVPKMLPQRRRAWTAWTTKAAQACLSNYLVMFPFSSVWYHHIHLWLCLPSLESNLHPDRDPVSSTALLLVIGQHAISSGGFDKHSQPDPPLLRLQATSFFSDQALSLPGCEDPSAVKGPGEGAMLKRLLFRHRQMAVIFTSSEDENYNVAQELAPLSHRLARKFFCKSDLNLSSCGCNRLRPGWSSVGAAGERILCVKWHRILPRPLCEREAGDASSVTASLSKLSPVGRGEAGCVDQAPEKVWKVWASVPALLAPRGPGLRHLTSRSFYLSSVVCTMTPVFQVCEMMVVSCCLFCHWCKNCY